MRMGEREKEGIQQKRERKTGRKGAKKREIAEAVLDDGS